MTTFQSTGTAMVPLTRITIGYNPRRYFDRHKHEELVASLRLRGMLQPILVRPAPEGEGCYTIVAGGRRYRAAIEAFGANGEIPVVIREMSDQEALEAAIDENDIRDDASETEQADAAVRVLAACRNDRAEAGRRLGWSRAKLDRRLALANLSEAVKLALDERRIKVGHAELLAAVPGDKQDKALETILGAGLDIAKTRDLLMRVTQNLADACFDKTECTTCPFNSGTQRALFETHVEDGHCTNSACFELKTEAVESARLQEEHHAAAAGDGADEDVDDQDDSTDETGDGDSGQPIGGVEAAARRAALAPGAQAPRTTAKSGGGAGGASVTAKSIAGRTSDVREATWRTALARGLADNADNARTAILVAALTGTLSQIKSATLTARAGLLVNPSFPDMAFKGKIEEVRELSDTQTVTALSAIGAAYARDAQSFSHVADLARAFDVDIRQVWQVDRAFLERYTKDELRFIARECGLVSHIGEKAFAKLLGSKKADLLTGMLNATGFDWAGHLPSAMTLDGNYGPPATGAAVPDRRVDAIAA